MSLFSLILYSIRFNTNNKRYLLKIGDRKEFQIRKKVKFSQFCSFKRALGKINVFKNCSSSIGGWRFS